MAVTLDTLAAAARARFGTLRAEGLPGALVAIELGDRAGVLAVGTSEAEGMAPIRPSAVMRIGSVSKLVIAGVAARMAARGAFRWDDRLDRWLPGVPRGGAITLEMLGAHRTGLRDALEDPAFRARLNRDPSRPVPLADVLATALALPPRFAPGTDTRYANTNALLLAEALAAAAGRPWRTLAEDAVLRPAGARLEPLGRLPWTAPAGYRFGARPGAIEYGRAFIDATAYDPSWAGPAGDLAGTIDDLVRLGRHLRERLVHTPAPGATLRAPAWHRLAAHWRAGMGHAGDVPGYSAFLGWTAEPRALIAVLANLSNLRDGRAPAALLAGSVLARLGD